MIQRIESFKCGRNGSEEGKDRAELMVENEYVALLVERAVAVHQEKPCTSDSLRPDVRIPTQPRGESLDPESGRADSVPLHG